MLQLINRKLQRASSAALVGVSRNNLTRQIQRHQNAAEAISLISSSLARLAFSRQCTVYCSAQGRGKIFSLSIYLLIYRYRTTVFITLLIPGSKVTNLRESNILRKVIYEKKLLGIKSGPRVMTSARVTKFSVGPSAISFLKPNIHDIESFFLLRNKQEHAVRAFVRYCRLFTEILVF